MSDLLTVDEGGLTNGALIYLEGERCGAKQFFVRAEICIGKVVMLR